MAHICSNHRVKNALGKQRSGHETGDPLVSAVPQKTVAEQSTAEEVGSDYVHLEWNAISYTIC